MIREVFAVLPTWLYVSFLIPTIFVLVIFLIDCVKTFIEVNKYD